MGTVGAEGCLALRPGPPREYWNEESREFGVFPKVRVSCCWRETHWKPAQLGADSVMQRGAKESR